ncbi:MAG: chorismate synthase [Ignavibacteriales bacterium]|nr:chorismate synthase [Ignavibacteriales bacterium]
MAGNKFGTLFNITTFGESHGKVIGVLIDGVKPNMKISEKVIQQELNRRRPGQSKVTTPRNESDHVEILSGVFDGRSLGTPICLLIRNKDQDSKAYKEIKDLLRPGHAGFTYLAKYGIQDYRGGGRASGRETAGRVAAGAVAKQILLRQGIKIFAYTKEVGGITANKIVLKEIENNSVRCPDSVAAKKMEKRILEVIKQGDSLGGIIEAVVKNCPAGLGEPVFDKLEADLAKALMSIPAIKGFEIGSGFSSAKMKGSEHNDEFIKDKKSGSIRTRTNYAGGILGGISTGEDIIIRLAVKPTSSISKKQNTVDVKGNRKTIRIEGRHDPCICPRVVPVVESMIALVLADHLMKQKLNRRSNTNMKIRNQINLIDDMLILLLTKRKELAEDVGIWKKKVSIPVYDAEREKEIYSQRLSLAAESGLDPDYIKDVYKIIIKNARKAQRDV